MNRRNVLVSIACIAVLSAVLGPSVFAAQLAARNVKCKNNLKYMGILLYVHTDKDRQGRFCTGATDWLRDGCPTRFGWTADMFEMNGGKMPSIICPAGPVKGLETINDLLGKPAVQAKAKLPRELWNRYAVPDCARFPVENVPLNEAAIAGGNRQRIRQVESFADQTLATNYVPSWWLVRSSFELENDAKGNAVFPKPWSARELGGSEGPLTIRRLESGQVPASVIPMFADAAPPEERDRSRRLAFDVNGVGKKGALLGANLSGGPVYLDKKSNEIAPLWPGQVIAPQAKAKNWMQCFCAGQSRKKEEWDSQAAESAWFQDTRQWGAVHGNGRQKQVHFLMADGSIKTVTDQNRDGYINPGFPVEKPTATFRDGKVEVRRFEVYLSACVPFWAFDNEESFNP